MKSTLQLLKAILLLLFTCIIINKTYSQSGTLDLNFGNGGKDTLAMLVSGENDVQKEQIQKILIQKDQKIVVAGFAYYESSATEGVSCTALARYNFNGSLDTTFGNKGKLLKDTFSYSNDATLQSDDKIIVVGDRLDTINLGYPLLTRFLKNGTIDTSFGIQGYSDTTGMAHNRFFQTEVMSNNSIVIVGVFTLSDSLQNSSYYVEKYLSNGKIDSSFGENGRFIFKHDLIDPFKERVIIIQPDDKILIKTFNTSDTGYYGITRLTSSGKYDLSFGDSGKIITGVNNYLNYEDTINNITSLVGLLNTGKIITRNSHSIYYFSQDELTQYNSDGSIDSSFGLNGRILINDGLDETSFLVQKDNKIVFGGNYYDESQIKYPLSNFALSRFNENGTIDTTFGNKGLTITDFGVYSKSFCSALQKDSKVLLGGNCLRTNEITGYGLENFALARYNNDVVLPVSLLSFTATKQQQSVLLNWQTANEINNNYFSIERSNNNRNFGEINKLQSTNNPSKINSYTTADLKPLNGWN